MNKEVLTKLRYKQDTQKGWKQGQVTWKEFRDTAKKMETGKHRIQSGQDIKSNNTSNTSVTKMKAKKTWALSLNKQAGDLIIQDSGKAEVMNASLSQSLPATLWNCKFQTSRQVTPILGGKETDQEIHWP